MLYHCEHCNYDFKADQATKQCPDCGKIAVREATEEEKAAYISLQKELDFEGWNRKTER